MKRILMFLFLSLPLVAQTSPFPASVVTDEQLKVQVNGMQTILTANVTATATTFGVASCGTIPANSLGTLDREILAILSCSGNLVTVDTAAQGCTSGRGCDNTSPAAHVTNTLLSLYADAWHHNSLRAEVEALEAALFALATPAFNGLHIGTGLLQTGTWSLSQGTGSGAHVWFQSTVANTGIKFHFWTNGSGTFSGIDYNNGSDTTGTNIGNLGISVNGAIAKIQTDCFGTGTCFTDLEVGETNHPPPGTSLQRISLYWDGVAKHIFTSTMATFPNVTTVMYRETLTTPSSSSAACTAGQFTDDASFHYVCTATNTWKRGALSSF